MCDPRPGVDASTNAWSFLPPGEWPRSRAQPLPTPCSLAPGPPAYGVPSETRAPAGSGGAMIDRMYIGTRPLGWPVMYQTWDKFLFLHWPIAADLLRPLIAPRLSLDTFEGQAWVSITPFIMWGIRPVLLPPLPVVSRSY